MEVQFTSRQHQAGLGTMGTDGDRGGVATLSASPVVACTRRAEWCATFWLGFAALIVLLASRLEGLLPNATLQGCRHDPTRLPPQ